MGKVVINNCYGGFSISKEAYNWLKDHNIDKDLIYCYNYTENCDYYGPRHHPLFIQCVEELGDKASGPWSKLEVLEFEGDIYYLTEYDGLESIATPETIYWENVNDY